MPAIHQFVAGFSRGDAISNEARVMQAIFRSWGCESTIYCEARRILPELRREAVDIQACLDAPPGPDDVVLLHLSIGSPLNEIFTRLSCRRAILYHNVTPSSYFRVVNPQTAAMLARGTEQVGALAGCAGVNLADSRYNADELTALGYSDVRVLPLVLDLDRLTATCDRGIVKRYRDGRTNILFVGRCAPNKRIEDLLTAFAHYTGTVDPDARLIHVGSVAGVEPYYTVLLARCRELKLQQVHFAGSVKQPELNAYYACADVFLSMSEHEGFGIPLIESMVHEVPVLAYAAAAVPETLDGAGVLFREKNYPEIVEMIARLATRTPLRDAILSGQRERLQRYRSRDLQAELRRHLAPLLDGR